MPHNIHHLIDQLPPTLEHIPNACLIRYLRIWTETLEGMVAGSQEWADLGSSFTKLLLTCFKQGEDRTKEIEYRLWYLEEGRVDELANYMRQRLQAYQANRPPGVNDAPLNPADLPPSRTPKSTRSENRSSSKPKNVMGKAIKMFTPSTTELTDQQKRACVPIFLPGVALGQRQITERELVEAALQLPSGATLQEINKFRYVKHAQSGCHRTVARIQFEKLCAPGPSGQQGEHAEQIYTLKHPTLKPRWHRATDDVTAMAMQGTLPNCCAWLLHTTLTWLQKTTQQEAEDAEDAKWTHMYQLAEAYQLGGQLLEAQQPPAPRDQTANQQAAQPTAPPATQDTHRPALPTQLDPGSDADLGSDNFFDVDDDAGPTAPTRRRQASPAYSPPIPPASAPPLRPSQVGEWLRKVITRRILDADKDAITNNMLRSKQ